jgi:5-formyltetrahydrofolate cyclo-ligase
MQTPSLDAEKSRLRRTMMRRLESISRHEALAAGEAISVRLASWSSWRSSSVVALFATLRGEVDTQPLIERAQREGKQLLFPRMLEGRALEFAVVDEIGSLQPGRYGVLEPDRRCPVLRMHTHAIVFVPGYAFDREGGRLGRGAGYYDRALAACGDSSGRPRFIGVGFDSQVIPNVPMNSLDMRMDGVVTEVGFFEVERLADRCE